MDTNDVRISLPASKSLSNRWLMINYLLGNYFRVSNLSTSVDTCLLRRLLQQLDDGSSNIFYCDNAGTVARFLMALLAITPGVYVLTGDDRLKRRPMAPLIISLRGMGIRLDCTEVEGFLPITIYGSMPTRRTVEVDPLLSSQFVSSLLLIAPVLPNGMSLTMTHRPSSRPYIDMTVKALLKSGVDIRRSSNGHTFYVKPFVKKFRAATVTIERDWSAASYFYTMALLRPNLRIRLLGLQLDSCQGDSAVDAFFQKLGVRSTEVRNPYRASSRSLTLKGGHPRVKAVTFSCLDCPDLCPTFAVAAAAAGVRCVLKGIANIALKESDRVHAVATELIRMGAKVRCTDCEMHILVSKLHPVEMVHTYDDHRIAMAFAPLRLIFPELRIENPGVVAKSFPDFWDQFALVEQS